jgi:hypothetical protein
MRTLILILCLSVVPACANHVPPTLSPAATVAFQNTQVQKALDLIRDVAHDANATVPPVLSTATTRQVTLWHQSAITVLHARGAGWQAAVTASLDELSTHLPAARPRLAPYIALAKTLIQEIGA